MALRLPQQRQFADPRIRIGKWATVGAGSVRPPVVAGFSWRGSAARDDSPLIALSSTEFPAQMTAEHSR